MPWAFGTASPLIVGQHDVNYSTLVTICKEQSFDFCLFPAKKPGKQREKGKSYGLPPAKTGGMAGMPSEGKRMLTYRIHLIANGLTEANLEGRYIGLTDEPLCPEGVKNLEGILENSEYPKIERLYSSPSLRCRQTASMVYPNNRVRLVEGLAEYDFGVFEGKTMEQLQLLYPNEYPRWLAGENDAAPPMGESNRQFIERILDGFDQMVREMMTEEVHSAALVTHGGIIMTLMALLAYPRKDFSQWVTENGMGFTVLVTPQLWMRDKVMEAYALIPEFYGDVTPEMACTFGVRDTIRLVDARRDSRDGQEDNWQDDPM